MAPLPDDPDNLNPARAIWALRALEAFARETGQTVADDGPEEIIGDLLVDLAHLADRYRLNFARLIVGAAEVYQEETDGSGSQFSPARP